ncbi:MAG: FAD-dependent oxidoreductase [Caldilineaceae bacterium]
MRRDISALANKEYDLIVVGGGIFGICAAWDAALRGLSVALIEQGDFGHATSANHFKVVHGGIRYLQHADIPRIRESSAERSALLRVAPHLVHPMPFVIPTYGHGMESREAMTAALIAYDLCTFDRNRGIKDPTRHIARPHHWAGQDAEMFPNWIQRADRRRHLPRWPNV